jgi:hypothetical protein
MSSTSTVRWSLRFEVGKKGVGQGVVYERRRKAKGAEWPVWDQMDVMENMDLKSATARSALQKISETVEKGRYRLHGDKHTSTLPLSPISDLRTASHGWM